MKSIKLLPLLIAFFSCGQYNDPVQPDIDSLIVVTDSVVIGIGESDSTLWLPTQVSYTPEGNIAILDKYKHCIKIYTTGSEYVRTVGREGEGPGELRLPNSFDFYPDGRLLITDAHHISCFNQEYAFIGRMNIHGSIPNEIVAVGDSSFVLERNAPQVNDGEPTFCYVIERWDWGAAEASVEYCRICIPFGVPSNNSLDKSEYGDLQHCVSVDGRVFYSKYSTEEFIVDGFEPTGMHYLHLEDRSYTRVPKSESEIQREIDSDNEYYSYITGRNSSIEMRPDPFKEAISDMFVDEEERLWLALGAFDGKIFRVYDMFGEHLLYAMVSPEYDVNPNTWVFSPGSNGRFLAFNSMAADSIRIYQMGLVANPSL